MKKKFIVLRRKECLMLLYKVHGIIQKNKMQIGEKVLTICFMFVIVLGNMQGVFANEQDVNEENMVVLYRDMTNKNTFKEVEEIFYDENISSVRIIDTKLMIKNQNDGDVTITPFAGYNITTGCRYPFQTVSPTILATASGFGGLTISIAKTSTVSNTVGATFGASKSMISAALKYNVTSSESIAIKGQWKIPNNLARGTLNAHVVYENYFYTVRLGSTVKGTDYSQHPIGVEFKRLNY